jgi:SAM-dependent methyltransferase
MQAYGRAFARVYNMRWGSFVERVAPLLLELYLTTAAGQAKRPVLDVCCGTGQLALHFLERGFRVVGLDLSEEMLRYAREKAVSYLSAGLVEFVQADASSFTLEDEQFGLAVSTYDALNHLPDLAALQGCFGSVCPVVVEGGMFVFDLNTRRGLLRWNNISVDESEDVVIINRGIYDGQGDRAYVRISGFVREADGRYERFEETVYNTVFDLEQVRVSLLDAGWHDVYFARFPDLKTPIEEPEQEGRVFVVARK